MHGHGPRRACESARSAAGSRRAGRRARPRAELDRLIAGARPAARCSTSIRSQTAHGIAGATGLTSHSGPAATAEPRRQNRGERLRLRTRFRRRGSTTLPGIPAAAAQRPTRAAAGSSTSTGRLHQLAVEPTATRVPPARRRPRARPGQGRLAATPRHRHRPRHRVRFAHDRAGIAGRPAAMPRRDRTADATRLSADVRARGPNALRAAEVEPRIVRRWLESGAVSPRAGGHRGRRTTRSRSRRRTSPARCTWATRSTTPIQDCWPPSPDARRRRTKWILGTDHAGIATQTQVERPLLAEGTSRQRARPRGGSSSASGSGAREYGGDDHRAAQAARRARCDYAPSASRSTRTTPRRCCKVFVAPLREGLHLPRPLHGQLGPGLRLGDLRPRGRAARGHRHALLHRLPAGVGLAARSRSRRCGPRRCSPTPRSPSTPTTSATGG